jgi:hypothetical protein
MSSLISRILLAILMLPIASLVFLITFCFYIDEHLFTNGRTGTGFVIAGVVTWIFLAAWWFFLWRTSVCWNRRRQKLTFAAVVVSAIAGFFAGAATFNIDDDLGCFVGATSAPLLWLVATTFLWRETPAERGNRIRATGKGSVVCPACGYNLTGLREARCPECGASFTLDELLASQPSAEPAELEH